MANSGIGPRKLYVLFAIAANSRKNCENELDNKDLTPELYKLKEEWSERWTDRAAELCSELMPSGSGFDNGTKFLIEDSDSDKLVFTTSFHHMNSYGSYDGWTEHKVTIRPDFALDYTIQVSGRNRNDIKDYIADTFREALEVLTDFPDVG
jgi:hypothetical protein